VSAGRLLTARSPWSGAGNFTLALARNFNRCVATEISKVSVRAARDNCEANNISNVQVVRMSAEEFSAALLTGREYVRLKEVQIESYDFDTILVDPPRAGLDTDSLTFVARFDKVVYISCNPETLARDLAQLRETHTVHRFATFDQFPYTDHLESGAFLLKK
jgi:tRNA (uracil-5-)-methyltransferase